MADQPRRLCVVASDWLRCVANDWLRCREFIAALGELLRPQAPLEVIMDRRRGGSLMESGVEDRRRQPQVDLALATNGFAIVPASVDPNDSRTQVALALPEISIEPLCPTDDEDRDRLESIRSFQRRRSGRLFPKLGDPFRKGLRTTQHFVEVRHALPTLTKLLGVLIGVTLATLVLSPAGQRLMGRMFQALLPTSGGQAAALASTKPGALRDADRLIGAPRETSPPLIGAGTPSRETGTPSSATSTSPNETSAPSKAATSQDGSGRSSLSAAARPSPSAPSAPPESKPVASKASREAATSKTTHARFAGSPRVVLAREPVSLAWGKSYAVRLLNPAGQPLAGAQVWLVTRRTDGTVESIPMGALPELGTYRATVPTRQSAPIDLRVRVSTGDKRVEVPVKP